MIRTLFNSGNIAESIIQILYFLICFSITITVHEVAHGYAAYKLGDPTAKNMGRLTLNPMKHLDIVGFLMILFLSFGWAKPVPINPRNFRNPQKGMAISAIAGPIANFCMALFGALLMRLTVLAFSNYSIYIDNSGNNFLYNFFIGCYSFFNLFCMINIRLGVFNLLPVPPLDGSRIVSYLLPDKLSRQYAKIERYSFILLMVLLYSGILSTPLMWMSNGIATGINFLLNLIPFLRI